MHLGFQNQSEFLFWLASQTKVNTVGAHNYLPVGSPYYFTFNNLVNFINVVYNNSIRVILIERNNEIESCILQWKNYFRQRLEEKQHRRKVSEEAIQTQHQEAVERKSKKASFDIFSAIRRKDIKAIISLRKRGIDESFKNAEGLTCLEYAMTLGNDNVIEALTFEIQ